MTEPSDAPAARPASAPLKTTAPGGVLDLSSAFEDALAALEKFEHIGSDGPAPEPAPASPPLQAGHVASEAAAGEPARTAVAAQAVEHLILAADLERTRTEMEEMRRQLGRANADAAQGKANIASLRRMMHRTEQDLPQQTARKLLDGLLPALDHLTTVSEYLLLHEPLTDHGRQAIDMLNAEWRRAMIRLQLEPFDAVGLPFDAQRHEIIARVADPMHPNDTVLRQAARGYLYNGRLLRSAQVVVNQLGGGAPYVDMSGQPERLT